MGDSLGDRMKVNYEVRYKVLLTRRTPVILRLDGKAFHTFTRGCNKPFDLKLIDTMVQTSKFLMDNIQGAKVSYTQSDEINILLTDFDRLSTDAWFGYSVQKMCSIASAMASVEFSRLYNNNITNFKSAYFDCRAFNMPREEIVNYFYWRFIDWQRNSLSMVAQANLSHKKLHKKNSTDMHEMLHQININWAKDFSEQEKNGTFIFSDNNLFNHINLRENDIRNWFKSRINLLIGEKDD